MFHVKHYGLVLSLLFKKPRGYPVVPIRYLSENLTYLIINYPIFMNSIIFFKKNKLLILKHYN